MPAIEIFPLYWQILARFVFAVLLIVVVAAIIYQSRDGKEWLKGLWQDLKEDWAFYFKRGPRK